jgi:type I restriction enzyme R subunit
MDQLVALAIEKEEAMKAARDSGLSARAFAVAWVLRDDSAFKAVGIDPMMLAKDAEELLDRFPNASVNADEQRKLRAALYKPLLALEQNERARVVDLIVRLLLAEASE